MDMTMSFPRKVTTTVVEVGSVLASFCFILIDIKQMAVMSRKVSLIRLPVRFGVGIFFSAWPFSGG